MSGHSTGKRRSRKAKGRPEKPYPEFPLYPHPRGYWAKKIGSNFYYFGRWGRTVKGKLERIEGQTWKAALEVYKARIDDIHAGRVKPGTVKLEETPDGLTVKLLCDAFYTAKDRKREAGELSRAQLREYDIINELLVAELGRSRLVKHLTPNDFGKLRATMAKRWGPVRLKKSITLAKSVFKFAWENGYIEKPIRFGTEFQPPDKAVLRKHRAEGGKKLFSRDELLALLAASKPQTRAMILLGINGGLGNSDVATLRESHVDLEAGFIDYPRPKTGIERRFSLWPETVSALREVIDDRPESRAPEHADLVFLTQRGTPLIRITKPSRVDNVAHAFGKLMKSPRCPECGVLQNGKKSKACESCGHVPKKWNRINGRRGLGFYSLRHTYRTAADAARDPVAVDLTMGHADATMGANYRHGIDDERLKAVADVVREWLWEGGAA